MDSDRVSTAVLKFSVVEFPVGRPPNDGSGPEPQTPEDAEIELRPWLPET